MHDSDEEEVTNIITVKAPKEGLRLRSKSDLLFFEQNLKKNLVYSSIRQLDKRNES